MKIKVVQPEKGEVVSTEIIATSIVAIAAAVRRMRSGRLNDTALVLLVHHACPSSGRMRGRPGIAEVRAVLAGLDALERTYLKKPPSRA